MRQNVERIVQTTSRPFLNEIMRHFLYFRAPVLTFKVSRHFALSIDALPFSVGKWLITGLLFIEHVDDGVYCIFE